MKLIKAILILSLSVGLTVCSAAGESVFCDIATDDENKTATIAVLSSENGEEMSESDIIVYIKESAEMCTRDGFESIVINVTDGLVNEKNIAELIDGIDVVCVTGGEELKAGYITGDTLIVYATDAAPLITAGEDNPQHETDSDKTPNETLNSMVLTCVVLIALALIVLMAAKKRMKK